MKINKKMLCIILVVLIVLVGIIYMIFGFGSNENKIAGNKTKVLENLKEKYEEGVLHYTFNDDSNTAIVIGLKNNVDKDSIKEIIIPNYVEKDDKIYNVVQAGKDNSPIFSYYKNLEKIKIAEGVSIAPHVFRDCKNLTSVQLPSSITKIPNDAFYGCENLVSIDIPDNVTEIEENAFFKCSKLKDINWSNNLAIIGICAFCRTDIENLDVPNTVTKIGQSAFASCSNLRKISIPNSVTRLEGMAFSGDSSLEEITIPDSITQIFWETFKDCTNLKRVNLPKNMQSMQGYGIFYGCSNLEEITIPNGVTEISQSAFEGCSTLKQVNLPDTLTQIEENAFKNCSNLQKITIPSNVNKIKSNAFYGCTNITITINGKTKAVTGFGGNWDRVDYKNGKTQRANIIWDTNAQGNSDNSTKSFEEKKVDSLSAVSWQYNKIDFSKLKWLNTEKYGNICIPDTWEKNADAEIVADKALTYGLSDVSQTIIMKDCNASNANSEVQNLLTKLSVDSKLEEWSSETTKIQGKNASIVSAKFSGINHIQSTLFIANEDQSKMIIVCVEASDPDVRKLLNTFTLEKKNEDATAYFEASTK